MFEVLSTSGDTHLGGDDFDRRIVDFMAGEFQKNEGIDLRKDRQALQRWGNRAAGVMRWVGRVWAVGNGGGAEVGRSGMGTTEWAVTALMKAIEVIGESFCPQRAAADLAICLLPANNRLTEAAEKAKIELSGVTQTSINLPFITATPEGPKHIDTNLTRAKFESMCSDLLDRVKVPVETALRDAKLSIANIDEVRGVVGHIFCGGRAFFEHTHKLGSLHRSSL